MVTGDVAGHRLRDAGAEPDQAGKRPGRDPASGYRARSGGTLTPMPTRRTVFRNGAVFDSRGPAFAPADVVIAGGEIVEVGTDLDGDDAVDARGKVIAPGLFDCHVHVGFSHLDLGATLFDPYSLQFFELAANLRTLLHLGLTTVRDAGYCDAGARVALERGIIVGPRLRVAVAMIAQTGGHADPWLPSGAHFPGNPGIPETPVDGVDSARRAVRELVRAGADQIKIAVSGGVLSDHTDPRLRQLRDDELAEIVAEAGVAGRDVMAHVHATAGAIAAVRAGVRSLEHGTMLDDDAVALMAERGTFLVPTLLAPHGVFHAAESGVALPPGAEQKARELIETHRDSFRRALAAGVPIAMGTDSPVMPHGHNLEELALMVEYGMTPEQSLQAATWTAARLMRLDGDSGSIEPGKRADLVVLDGDLGNLTDLAGKVEQVWLAGEHVHRPSAAATP